MAQPLQFGSTRCTVTPHWDAPRCIETWPGFNYKWLERRNGVIIATVALSSWPISSGSLRERRRENDPNGERRTVLRVAKKGHEDRKGWPRGANAFPTQIPETIVVSRAIVRASFLFRIFLPVSRDIWKIRMSALRIAAFPFFPNALLFFRATDFSVFSFYYFFFLYFLLLFSLSLSPFFIFYFLIELIHPRIIAT